MIPTPDRLRGLFAEVAPTYERVNRVLTLGLDRRWRRAAARAAAEAAGGTGLWLDVCSGTGDMARSLLRRSGGRARVVAVDFCLPMLARAAGPDRLPGPEAVAGDVRRLPFPDGTFDLLTSAFATRNIHASRPVLEETFREFRRVLRPGGRFVNLETSQPRFRLARWLFRLYVRALVKPIGARISGSVPGYAYLAATIPKFYGAEELAAIMGAAGFSRVEFRRLLLGAAAIHVAAK